MTDREVTQFSSGFNVVADAVAESPLGPPGFLEAFQVLLRLDELELKGFRVMCSLR